MEYGFHRRGHYEPLTPTPEQVAQHARASELIAELEANPYVCIGGYDSEFSVEPLQTERWVADETHEEWMARWREHRATNPNEQPPANPFHSLIADMSAALARSMDTPPIYRSGPDAAG